jgi:plasmid stabilization system protein ParE
MLQVLEYLKDEWGDRVAMEFLNTVYTRIGTIQINPFVGAPTGIGAVRSIHVTRHNRMYYRLQGNKVIILNLYDTRSNKKM